MPTTTSTSTTPKPKLWPIFLTAFIDMLGIGIVIPIIPVLFFDVDGVFHAEYTIEQLNIIYGFLIASFPFMQFFGAPIIGSISDRVGRKPVLTVTLLGAFFGYILFAYAVMQENLILLFIARMIPGFMGGNISTVMSAISDVSEDKDKPKNFGLVGMAFGLGFVLGPSLGGILADPDVYYTFNPATPIWVTAGLTLLNVVLLKYIFKETLSEEIRLENKASKINLLQGFSNIFTSFKIPDLRRIFISVLFYSMGFAFFAQFFAVYLIKYFQFSEREIGLLFGYVGLWLVFTQAVLVRQLSKRISSNRIVLFSMAALSVSIGLLLLPSDWHWFLVIHPMIAISQGLTSPNMTTIVSNSAPSNYQGQILGINQSMLSLGNIIPPIVGGFLSNIDGAAPILVSSLLVGVAWLLLIARQKKL